MVIFLLVSCQPDDAESPAPSTKVTSTWTAIAVAPFEGRKDFVFLPLADSVFIWGGDGTSGSFANGGLYSVETDQWSTLPAAPITSRTDYHDFPGQVYQNQIWLYGGRHVPDNYWADASGTVVHNDLVSYDPDQQTWTLINTENPPPKRAYANGVFHEQKLYLFAGNHQPVADGDQQWDLDADGSYDPATPVLFDQLSLDGLSWERIQASNAPTQRKHGLFMAIEDQLIAWGGGYDHQAVDTALYSYSLSTEEWSRMVASEETPSPREYFSSVLCNERILVWGGVIAGEQGMTTLADGAQLDPYSKTWTSIASGGPSARVLASAVCTGSQIIIWGGFSIDPQTMESIPLGDGGIYDLQTQQWTAIENNSNIPARGHHRAHWTGDKMLIFGGTDMLFSTEATYFNDGWLYTPPSPTE